MMNIDFTKEQFDFLKEIVADYRDFSYSEIFDNKRYELDSDDPLIKRQYSAMAEDAETRFNEAKALHEHLEKSERENAGGKENQG